jgi:hypothetical protein
MSITRTSTYAAFGNKEDPLRKALEHYTERSASHATRTRRESTARQVTTAFLDGSVHATTPPCEPAGCLGIQGTLLQQMADMAPRSRPSA